jgi:hypothetical protein
MTREEAWKSIGTVDTQLDTSTLTRILDNLYGSEYQFLWDTSLLRVSDANEYYDYYDLGDAEYGTGQYWSMPNTLGYNPTVLILNLARWFVKKRAAWMFEVAPDVECPAKVVDSPDDMEKIEYEPSARQVKLDNQASGREQILYKLWSENNFDEKLLAGALDYFIGGTVALKIRYLPYKGIRLDFAPTQEVFPIPNADEPDKFDQITFCSYYNNKNQLWKQVWKMVKGKCVLSEGIYDANNLKLLKTLHADRETGLDFIPVLLFPNDALSGEMFGMSYLRDMIPAFDQYNRSMSDAADSLRFNMFAINVLINAPPDAEKMLKIAPNELWNIGGEQVDVKKLEASFNYSAALADFLTRLENVMHLLGEVPDVTPDRIKGFGLVSGVALKLLYGDLVSATQRSWRIWKSRLTTANEYMLRMLETYNGTEGYPYDFKISDIRGEYENRIIPHLPLPENEAEKVALEVNKLTNSLQSVKGAMQELGEKFPERKIAEIIGERKKFLDQGGLGKKLSEEEKLMLSGDKLTTPQTYESQGGANNAKPE